MQDIFENAKRVANTAVERAAWEADKLRRATARQRDIELAQRERTTLVEQIATTLLDLDKRGQVTEEPLKMLAQRLRTLDNEVHNGQDEVKAIRNETFQPGTISISVTRQGTEGTTACPTCGKPTRSNAAFCSNCGARLR
ncbi:MAG: zinc ribbon domain-containing protein [Ktedonobacterales bacterium]